ncbi:hypothetical protein ES703_46764 [subsurface metagenome]
MPSGNFNLPSTISDRRSGIVNSTPKTPPNPAIIATHLKLKLSQVPNITSAGSVNITPAASDSPADAAVWTMLFSRILLRRNSLSTPIETTAAGIDAETVIPANRPRYAFAPASTTESTTPKTTALTVISANDCPSEFIAHLCQIRNQKSEVRSAVFCPLSSVICLRTGRQSNLELKVLRSPA